MQTEINTPDTVEAETAEIVSILARGYMRYRSGRRLSPDSGNAEVNVTKVLKSKQVTEKRLDLSGHRSLHSATS